MSQTISREVAGGAVSGLRKFMSELTSEKKARK